MTALHQERAFPDIDDRLRKLDSDISKRTLDIQRMNEFEAELYAYFVRVSRLALSNPEIIEALSKELGTSLPVPADEKLIDNSNADLGGDIHACKFYFVRASIEAEITRTSMERAALIHVKLLLHTLFLSALDAWIDDRLLMNRLLVIEQAHSAAALVHQMPTIATHAVDTNNNESPKRAVIVSDNERPQVATAQQHQPRSIPSAAIKPLSRYTIAQNLTFQACNPDGFHPKWGRPLNKRVGYKTKLQQWLQSTDGQCCTATAVAELSLLDRGYGVKLPDLINHLITVIKPDYTEFMLNEFGLKGLAATKVLVGEHAEFYHAPNGTFYVVYAPSNVELHRELQLSRNEHERRHWHNVTRFHC